jgi:hypothetical protein
MPEEKKGNLIKTRALPTFETVGNRQVLSSGRWNDIKMADYIMQHGQTRWIEISELAKTAYGHNNNDTKTKARRYLHKVFTLLIDRGVFMVTEYEPRRRRALAVKLQDRSSEADRQHIIDKLDRMRTRREITAERYDRAVLLLEC